MITQIDVESYEGVYSRPVPPQTSELETGLISNFNASNNSCANSKNKMQKLIKLFPITISFIMLFYLSYAQTNVSGFISANTTWNLSGSPYIVIGNTLVSHSYTLTIDPGVIIKFVDSFKAIQIDGELIAIGTPANRITFTSNQSIPVAGDWGKIHFADTCLNAVFDSTGNYVSGCIMKYCDVLYGGGLGYGTIHIEGSSPYISNCNILNSSSDGIYSVGAAYLLDSSAVKNCAEYGLSFTSIQLNSCGLTIKGDTIENNMTGGIKFNSSAGNCLTSITNNYFISNTTNGAINAETVNFSKLVIAHNSFINNDGASGILNFYSLSQDTIKCNKFIGNHSSSQGCIRTYLYSSGIITDNIFNSNTGQYTVVHFVCDGSGQLFFSNNYMANNVSNYLGSCNFWATMTNSPNLHIDHNTFVNNSGASALYISGPNLSNSNLNFLYFKHNNFSDPGAQFELDNSIPYGSPNIYADSNYWGSTNTQHIDSVINDYFDLANLSVVYYSPILTSPISIDTSCTSIFTGIVSNKVQDVNLVLYPNPTVSHVTISFDKIINKGTIELINILGGSVLQEGIDQTSKKEINLQTISSGIYLMKLFDGEKYYCKKLIIEHD